MRKKGGEEKNTNCCTLSFCGYFGDLAAKKTVGRKGPFAGNFFKNPARNV